MAYFFIVTNFDLSFQNYKKKKNVKINVKYRRQGKHNNIFYKHFFSIDIETFYTILVHIENATVIVE